MRSSIFSKRKIKNDRSISQPAVRLAGRDEIVGVSNSKKGSCRHEISQHLQDRGKKRSSFARRTYPDGHAGRRRHEGRVATLDRRFFAKPVWSARGPKRSSAALRFSRQIPRKKPFNWPRISFRQSGRASAKFVNSLREKVPVRSRRHTHSVFQPEEKNCSQPQLCAGARGVSRQTHMGGWLRIVLACAVENRSCRQLTYRC